MFAHQHDVKQVMLTSTMCCVSSACVSTSNQTWNINTDRLSSAKWSIWQQSSRQKAASDPHQHQPFFNQLPCLSCRHSCHRVAGQVRRLCVLLWANPWTRPSDCALFFLPPLPYLLPCLLLCSGLLTLKYPISLLYPLKLLWRLNRCHSL